jgi:hypothetical protein
MMLRSCAFDEDTKEMVREACISNCEGIGALCISAGLTWAAGQQVRCSSTATSNMLQCGVAVCSFDWFMQGVISVKMEKWPAQVHACEELETHLELEGLGCNLCRRMEYS